MNGIKRLRFLSARPPATEQYLWLRNRRSLAAIVLLLASRVFGAALDEPWFDPPGGTWVPDAATIFDMRRAFNSAVAPALAARSVAGQPPARYWFQYQGRGAGADKTIVIIGHPFPVSQGAEKRFFDVSIPENCVVYAEYAPKPKQVRALSVSGLSCPPRS
jgi:hypothetical protein